MTRLLTWEEARSIMRCDCTSRDRNRCWSAGRWDLLACGCACHESWERLHDVTPKPAVN